MSNVVESRRKLSDWSFLFFFREGSEVREKVMQKFLDFLENPGGREVIFTDRFNIAGRCGTKLICDRVLALRFDADDDQFVISGVFNLVVTTVDNGEFCIDFSSMSEKMQKMFTHLQEGGVERLNASSLGEYNPFHMNGRPNVYL